MKKLNTLGVMGLLSLAAVGCGGEYTPEEEQAMQLEPTGEVQQREETAWIDAGQTRDFSTWLFGVTPFSIKNDSYTDSVPFSAWCGSNSITGSVSPRATYTSSLNCAWPGARLYVHNDGYLVGNQVIFVRTW
ncbi:hypothetical protein [Corallococcus macrosporus]|uniref:Putative lipoprotein n=1 Tax=Myxococcus fulvus (strain ATCC BAA-855 / HW-1) TaxID=483219 RepID=F8CB28_MYXFH|nr:hypothetical protein [Corallococcus macrosporus]AEI68409.1 putative lipoprotein [Corallococcus macrosporus]